MNGTETRAKLRERIKRLEAALDRYRYATAHPENYRGAAIVAWAARTDPDHELGEQRLQEVFWEWQDYLGGRGL